MGPLLAKLLPQSQRADDDVASVMRQDKSNGRCLERRQVFPREIMRALVLAAGGDAISPTFLRL